MIPKWFSQSLIFASLLSAVLSISAQATTSDRDAPAYEVASVRQNLAPDPSWRMDFTDDGVRAVDVTLEYALHEAFGVYDDQLWSGYPAWIKQKRFDIEAKYDSNRYPKLTLGQRRTMLQQLLIERFKLVVHCETRRFPQYALVVAKHGPLFKETKREDLHDSSAWGVMCKITRSRRGVLEMSGCSMDALASSISDQAGGDLGRKVVDQTGLKGYYDFKLDWTPMMTSTANVTESNTLDNRPSIFTAIREQLGLELKRVNGPLDVIVVDHVEMPSEN